MLSNQRGQAHFPNPELTKVDVLILAGRSFQVKSNRVKVVQGEIKSSEFESLSG